jgi:hypothetical protein
MGSTLRNSATSTADQRTEGWKAVPDAARKAFPAVERIMQSRIVRRSQTPASDGG